MSETIYTYGYLRVMETNSVMNNELYMFDDSDHTYMALLFASISNKVEAYVVDIPTTILPITQDLLKTEMYHLNLENDSLIYNYIKDYEKKLDDYEKNKKLG